MTHNKLPYIDIIIVNYNGMKYLPECLNSLFLSEYPNFSVIIVDNNSADNSVSWIKKNYPQAAVIQNSSNEGFGKANQRGIRYGTAPFFVLLNNDTKVNSKWLLPLARTMQKYPLCAAACSTLLFMDNPQIINAAGGCMNFVGYGYDHDIFSVKEPLFESHLLKSSSSQQDINYLSSSNLSNVRDVFFPTAAAALFRRSFFDDIGGFDEKFFMYHEDVDLGWRFNLKGYSIKYVPDSVVFHAFGGTSLKSGSMNFRNRLGLRHALRSLLKNYELYSLKKVLPIFCQLGINNFRAGIPTGFFRAVLWNLIMLPDTIIKRARVQRSRINSDKELSKLIWQDIYLPVQFPDYQIHNLKSFADKIKNTLSLNAANSFSDKSLSLKTTDLNLKTTDLNARNLNQHINNYNADIEIIDPAACNLGYGWHCCEVYFGDGVTRYRWTRNKAQFFFWHFGGDAVLTLKVLGLSMLLKRKRYFSVEITTSEQMTSSEINSEINKDESIHLEDKNISELNQSNRYKKSFIINSDYWEEFQIEFSGTKGVLEAVVSVSDTWSPHEKFNNRDYRVLGIGISSAVLKEKL